MTDQLTYPVKCPCGWEGTPRPHPAKASLAVRRHQKRPACPLSPDYVPPEERKARSRALQSAAASRRGRPGGVSTDRCTVMDGPCDCPGCRLAARDRTHPLDLTEAGGQWVRVGNVRKWVAA